MSYVYNVFSFIIKISYKLFQVSFFRVKMVIHYKFNIFVGGIEHQLQQNLPQDSLHYSFLLNLH